MRQERRAGESFKPHWAFLSLSGLRVLGGMGGMRKGTNRELNG